MTVVDRTEPSQIETIAFEIELDHPPEKVWRALTEPELLAQWLLPVADQLQLAPGAEFTLKTQPYPGWDGTVNCRFVEIEKFRTLRYTWTVPFLDTVVTFTLTPNDTGTRLTIVQSGFTAEQKRESGGARYGWKTMGGRLIDLLARMP
ncbi:MAG TPA: SRPBCC domain-containing protein [Gemmatimonadaceae bacterium]